MIKILLFLLFLFIIFKICNKKKSKGGNIKLPFKPGDYVKITETGNIGVVVNSFIQDDINLVKIELNEEENIVVKENDIELINKYIVPLDKKFIEFLKNTEWLNLNELEDDSNMLDLKVIMYNKTKTTEMEELYNQKVNEINQKIGQKEKILEENIIKAQIMDISTQYKPYELYLYNLYDLYKSLNNFKLGKLDNNICKKISDKYNYLCESPIITDQQYNQLLQKQLDTDLSKTQDKLNALIKIKKSFN
jgi:preprotein translocase subunit YajC